MLWMLAGECSRLSRVAYPYVNYYGAWRGEIALVFLYVLATLHFGGELNAAIKNAGEYGKASGSGAPVKPQRRVGRATQ